MCACAVTFAGLSAGVLAQESTPGSPPPTPAPTTAPPAQPRSPEQLAQDAVTELQNAYRSSPTCERVNLEVRSPGPGGTTRVSRATYLVRFDPATSEPSKAPRLYVELAQLRLWASAGTLTLMHARDATRFFQCAYSGLLGTQSVSQCLPPVPMPSLDLASPSPCASFSPYAPSIAWEKVEIDPRGPGRRIITGRLTDSDAGTLRLEVWSGRARRLVIDRPSKRSTLVFSMSPVMPCTLPALVDTQMLRRVDTPEELHPGAGAVRVGTRLPEMPLSLPTGEPGLLASLFDAPAEAAVKGVPAAEHAVLVFTLPGAAPRLDADELAKQLAVLRRTTFGIGPSTKLSGEPGEGIARFGYARILVLTGASPDRVLDELRASADLWRDHLLWTSDRASTVDVLAPGSAGVAAIIDADRVLRAVVAIDAQTTTQQVLDQITAALYELAPAQTER